MKGWFGGASVLASRRQKGGGSTEAAREDARTTATKIPPPIIILMFSTEQRDACSTRTIARLTNGFLPLQTPWMNPRFTALLASFVLGIFSSQLLAQNSNAPVNLAVVAQASASEVSGDTSVTALNDNFTPRNSADNRRVGVLSKKLR